MSALVLRPASLRAALELLTRLPVPVAKDFQVRDAVDGAAWYPAVGMLVGGLLGLAAWGLTLAGLTPAVSVVLLTITGLLLTGALHEDGLADAADGLFGGWTPERRLEIMRDSRLGTYGGAALFGALALRVAALLALAPAVWPLALVLAHGLSRWGGLVLLATGRAARSGDAPSLAAQVVNGVGRPHLAAGTVFLVPLVLLSPLGTALGLGLCVAVMLPWSALCRAKVGGLTGDLVGGGILLCELAVLVGLGQLSAFGA